MNFVRQFAEKAVPTRQFLCEGPSSMEVRSIVIDVYWGGGERP